MSQKGAISGPGNHQKGREIPYAYHRSALCDKQLCQQSLSLSETPFPPYLANSSPFVFLP